MENYVQYWWVLAIVLFIFSGLVTVNQGYISVITMFGKYRRILRPGLNFKIPFLEQVYRRVSIQNRAVEMEFQAVTHDQANVYFKNMLVYAVQNSSEETIMKVAFKFISERDLMQALTRTIEGTIRSFVATKRQAEILGLRKEIVEYVKEQIDHLLEEWGYHLLDLQINDITFDKVILDSMSRVVASNNLKAAAENEGQALLITKTKAAEAEGNSIKIAAEAERRLGGALGVQHGGERRPGILAAHLHAVRGLGDRGLDVRLGGRSGAERHQRVWLLRAGGEDAARPVILERARDQHAA